MGFFSELKNDLSQAVNTLMPDDKADGASILDEGKTEESSNAHGGKKDDVDIDGMLNRLDDIKLDELANEDAEEEEEYYDEEDEPQAELEEKPVEKVVEMPSKAEKEAQKSALEFIAEMKQSTQEAVEIDNLEDKIEKQTAEEVKAEQPKTVVEKAAPVRNARPTNSINVEQYVAPTAATSNNIINGGNNTMDFEQQTPTDETACITEGMAITGDVKTTGSLDLIGKVTGNIACLGKLNVTGEIVGDSDAAEIYAEAATISGEVRSKGSVKVGQSTVIVGNIYGTSAVIAGAVKGDIDVHGPVVLDTTAIVMGNIKSQSVQINNGAVIEGMCSQAYADVNPSEFFEQYKNR